MIGQAKLWLCAPWLQPHVNSDTLWLPLVNVAQVKRALLTYGAVVIGVEAADGWFTYSGGVFRADYCDQPENFNHAVLIVGW